ncbi:hypothetical protein K8I28_09020 [bacterium]|nr:hypothetical protein [bacterium]
MMRRYGLLAGVLIGMLVLASLSFGNDVSIFSRSDKNLEHKYGIQISGGADTYLLDDVNDYRILGTRHTEVGNTEDAVFGINYGLAIIYRSHENFRYSIGYSVLSGDRVFSEWPSQANPEDVVQYEQVASATEFYIMGSYMWNVSDLISITLGGGPTIVNGKLDRAYSQSTSSEQNFRGAKGRTLGVRLGLGLELYLGDMWSLNLNGGFRYANIYKMRFDDRFDNQQTVVWGQNRMNLDMTGGFVELGLRMYFKPTTEWWTL